MGSHTYHGEPSKRVYPRRIIQTGIRGSLNHPDMVKFSHDSGMRVVYVEEFTDKGWRWAAEEARKVVGTGPSYLSFDVDGLDPVFALGTGTPEPGGLSMIEGQRLIRELGGLDFIGGDVVEVSPPFDSSGLTAQNAASILFEILCVLALALQQRKG